MKYLFIFALCVITLPAIAQQNNSIHPSAALPPCGQAYLTNSAITMADTITLIPHWLYSQIIYRDTVIDTGWYQMPIVNAFTYSYHNKDTANDTLFTYNHYRWLLQKTRTERDYCAKKCHYYRIQNNIDRMVDYGLKRDYWSGVAAILEDMLYKQGKTKFIFETK